MKDKGQRQPLALHQQQLYKYHHLIVYPLVYLVDEPVMAITVDPIIVPSLKITTVSPSLVAFYIDDPVPVLDDKAELDKLVESSDADLHKIIKLRCLCSVTIPETFLSGRISTANIVADNSVYHNDLDNLHNNETIVARCKNKTYCLTKVDTTVFYDDSP